MLLRIARAAVETIPGASWAAITEVRARQEVSVRSATADIARRADLAQHQTGQGPCLDAAYLHQTLRVADFGTDQRWPQFATHAAVAMAGANRGGELTQALTSRDVIGQAKCILMERYQLDAQTAFNVLVRTSQHAQLKLVVIAEELTSCGRLRQE